MKKNIVIVSQNTHSFLRNEIEFASRIFQRVVVICPYDKLFNEVILKLPNVDLVSYSKKELYINGLFSLHQILEKEKRAEIVQSIKRGRFSKKYIKFFLFFLALAKLFSNKLKSELNLTINESRDWVFYSAWYDATAYAVSEAKKKYRYASAISLAHSFEVDKIKNKHTDVLFRNVYHDRLDKISFISRNVFENYKEDVANKLNLSLENTEVRYLGTKKLSKGFSVASNDGVIRIISCSHVVPVKRIDLIFYALDELVGQPIEWTHLGDGEQMGYIKKLIKQKKNPELDVKLLGAVENTKIHEYYANNTIDLFINASSSEGIPVSIMEAIAYGIPVIATNVGGNSEIVKKDFGKLISSNPTNKEIQEAIIELYNKSESEKKQMRKNAANYFKSSFNAELLRKNFFLKLSLSEKEVT